MCKIVKQGTCVATVNYLSDGQHELVELRAFVADFIFRNKNQ